MAEPRVTTTGIPGLLIVGSDTPLGAALLAQMPGAHGVAAGELDPTARAGDPVDLSAFDTLISAHGDILRSVPTHASPGWTETAERARLLAGVAIRHGLRCVQVSTDCVFEREALQHEESAALDLSQPWGQSLAAAELAARIVPGHLIVRTGWVATTGSGLVQELTAPSPRSRPLVVDDQERGRLISAARLAAGIQHLLDAGASGTFNLTGEGAPSTRLELARAALEWSGQNAVNLRAASAGANGGVTLALDKIKGTGFHPGNADVLLHELIRAADPSPIAHPDATAPTPPADAPLRVLFVCTANICRSAYADVIASAAGIPGLTFSSAGTHALVGHGMDPPLAGIAAQAGVDPTHSARQLTRAIAEDADLILTMAGQHRRFILDAWPSLARKTFVIGQAVRSLHQAPTSPAAWAEHLWRHRAPQPGDDVPDPYGKGQQAAASVAHQLDVLVARLLAAGQQAPARQGGAG